MTLIQQPQTISNAANIDIANTSILNSFNLLKDISDGTLLVNIWRNYAIEKNITNSVIYYDTYIVEASDWWDLISYKTYGDVKYWWLIALVNGIHNPFEELTEGMSLKILKISYIYQLLKEIKAQAVL